MSTVDVEIIIQPRGRRKPLRDNRAVQAAGTPRIPRIARLMALAIKFQQMVERGEVRDYADLARLGFVTRARMTQIMNLLYLAPDIQERLLFLDPAVCDVQETNLRRLVRIVWWPDQRYQWSRNLAGASACIT